jgi:alpha-L-rhamnosidase
MNKRGVCIMRWIAEWIRAKEKMKDVCPVFKKEWKSNKKIKEATLYSSALGIYKICLNGRGVSDYVLAPGWTAYETRVQYQAYDITALLQEENVLTAIVGKGWYSSPMPGWIETEDKERRKKLNNAWIAELHLTYEDDTKEIIPTDETWEYAESPVRFSEIYDGETYEAGFIPSSWKPAIIHQWSKEILVAQEGEIIKEQERINAVSVFITPKGETVVDFGQEVTGYIEFELDAKQGEKIRILHGEVLDKEGNFFNENYRSAKSEINYICKNGKQKYSPQLTFFGFRYIKLAEFPVVPLSSMFTAVVVHSDIKRIGCLSCSNESLNKLFTNIIWGQKGNFLDIPTDCPQRDERLGWTGDAQTFIKAASYNYDVEKFFSKWLHDLKAEQGKDGAVGQVVPDYMPDCFPSAAWGDASTICPWQIYMAYGNKQILSDQFESMKKWVDYITNATTEESLWIGGEHFGDWLGLDAPQGSYRGSSREDFIASAFYAYSTSLVIKAGKVLGEDISEYEQLHANIKKAFNRKFTEYNTQTECILAVWFELTEDKQKAADKLAELIKQAESKLQTGFVGTPYILHVLSGYGYTELAYTLLLRTEYPSWLYPVTKGATTIWEHWDGIMEDGNMWSNDMNSFNHYAYGAVADWVYEVAAGITPLEAGFAKVIIAPQPDKRLSWLRASINTRYGQVISKWEWDGTVVKYEIETPVEGIIIINDEERKVVAGKYCITK